MVLRECPFCHRPFEAELLSKEQIDASEAASVGDFPIETNWAGGITEGGLLISRGSMVLPLSAEEREAVAVSPAAFITYKSLYKCKHCGKEWTKISVEAKKIPRAYVEDEGEKTDYDAHVEEEEAREEQYARE